MAEIKSLEENNAPREKREKLITGEAKTRKRLGDVFIAEDVRTVKNHIFIDVVVPAIKTVIVDIVTNGIQMMLWGDTINRGKAPGTKYNYGNCYSISSYPTIVTFTPKKIALPSEAFGTLAFKSLVEKTDLSTEVLTLLNKQPKQYTGTLLATGWAADANGYQAQTISISGLKASYDVDPQWDVVLSGTDPDADAALLEGFALIHNYKTGVNSLTAQCIGSTPTINIPVKVVIFG